LRRTHSVWELEALAARLVRRDLGDLHVRELLDRYLTWYWTIRSYRQADMLDEIRGGFHQRGVESLARSVQHRTYPG
jgi:hypothetical protein